jgi:hypothetical protein
VGLVGECFVLLCEVCGGFHESHSNGC